MSVLSYLRFSLRPGADREDFERDLRAMLELASAQPGFRWADMGPSMRDPHVYLVVSEWDEVEHVRSWEHEEEHSGVMEKWEPQYHEALLHRRYVPWQRPAPSADPSARSTPAASAASSSPATGQGPST